MLYAAFLRRGRINTGSTFGWVLQFCQNSTPFSQKKNDLTLLLVTFSWSGMNQNSTCSRCVIYTVSDFPQRILLMPVMSNCLPWNRGLPTHLEKSHPAGRAFKCNESSAAKLLDRRSPRSKTKPKSKGSGLSGDFVSSIQALDLQCNYLRCSWDMVTFVHVETAG